MILRMTKTPIKVNTTAAVGDVLHAVASPWAYYAKKVVMAFYGATGGLFTT